LFAAKREDGTREWRKLRNEKAHHLYSTKLCSHDQIRMRWAGYMRLKQTRNLYSISLTKSEMKRAVRDLGIWRERIRLSKVDQMADCF
jgi:hypothetical protein